MAGAAVNPSLKLQRRFAAPARLVYAAWTEPERMLGWWATKDAVTLHAEADVRVGGRFRVRFRTPDGEDHDVSGTYLDVEPEKKLVFTWSWISTPERQSRVTLVFKDEGEKCLLTLLHEQFADEAARDNHRTGWAEALDNLETFVAARAIVRKETNPEGRE
ncbi:MAG: SRPBCC domain-containing protein [Alphaproteobacteria bacterium]|nr:SRPBCC domain-containing protein [Alphaproteobacteria bacterium]